MNNCKNCTSEISGNYCSNCGLKIKLERINGHYVKHEIEHLLHFEKGLFYTIKELILRPGKNVSEFLTENRGRLVKPIVYLIVTSLIYSVIAHYFHVQSYVNFETNEETTTAFNIFKWGDAHSGYANLIMGVFIALWVRVFFKNRPFNIYEILILLCFVSGTSMIIFSVFTLFQGLTHLNIQVFSGLIGIIYCTWAIGNFFGAKSFASYFKAFLSYILGLISFSLVIVIIGELIDKIL